MIAKGNHFVFVLLYIIDLCAGVWVTTNLTVREINNIFTSARDQGRSNAELMYQWTEESKGEMCRSVLISDAITDMNFKYFDKSDHLVSEQEVGSDIFDRHYSPLDNDQQESDAELESKFIPIYPLAPRAIVVEGKSRETFGFPCLVTIEDKVEEVYIADGYVEKTYIILIETRILENDLEDETLSIMGFVEIPPERPPAVDQETLEELYYVSLSALQVNSFLCWPEDKSLINPISTLSEKEKVKLCSLVNDAIHSNVDGWIAGLQFEIENFEHGPLTFTKLKKDPPNLSDPYKNIRGIECKHENINFILVPNWLQKNGTFVLTYSDSKVPVQMDVDVPNLGEKQLEISRSLEKEQEVSTSRKRKSLDLRSRTKIAETSKRNIVSKTTKVTQKTVVLIFHVEGVSFLVNKENDISIII